MKNQQQQTILRPITAAELQSLIESESLNAPVVIVFDIDDSDLAKRLIANLKVPKLVYVNLNILKEAREKFAIVSIPTVVSVCPNRELGRFSGTRNEEFCEEFLNSKVRNVDPCKGKSVIQVDAVEHFNELMAEKRQPADKDKKLVILDFFAEWCFPCRRLSTIIDRLANIRQDSIFAKVDVDSSVGMLLAEHFNVVALPTICLVANQAQFEKDEKFGDLVRLPGGNECFIKVACLTGVKSESEINDFINMGIDKLNAITQKIEFVKNEEAEIK